MKHKHKIELPGRYNPWRKTACKRCGRTDLPIRSNGYCSRCDAIVFGK